MLNNLCLMGRLVDNPKTTKTESGVIYNFTLATDTNAEETSFIDCKAYDLKALDFVKKGDKIAVSGYIRQEKWTAKDGSGKSKIVAVVRGLEFASNKESEDESDEITEAEVVEEPVKKPVAKTYAKK